MNDTALSLGSNRASLLTLDILDSGNFRINAHPQGIRSPALMLGWNVTTAHSIRAFQKNRRVEYEHCMGSDDGSR